MSDARETQRLDLWLHQARFFKTRALAARLVKGGRLRIGGERTDKPHRGVGAGDVLTFPQGSAIRVIRVTGLPERRGPASEARTFYEDLDADADAGPRDGGGSER